MERNCKVRKGNTCLEPASNRFTPHVVVNTRAGPTWFGWKNILYTTPSNLLDEKPTSSLPTPLNPSRRAADTRACVCVPCWRCSVIVRLQNISWNDVRKYVFSTLFEKFTHPIVYGPYTCLWARWNERLNDVFLQQQKITTRSPTTSRQYAQQRMYNTTLGKNIYSSWNCASVGAPKSDSA